MLMQPTRLPHFLIIFGMRLLSIVVLLVVLAIKQRLGQWKVGLATAVSLLTTLLLLMLFLGIIIASSQEGFSRITNLASDLDLALSPRPDGTVALGWGMTAVFTILPAVIRAKLSYPGVTLLLLAVIALIVMIWNYKAGEQGSRGEGEKIPPAPVSEAVLPLPPTLPFVLLLIFTGALLTLGPEFVYLRDNFGQRLNTTFKFYYQAWVMFGVAGLFAIDYLWRELRGAARVVPAVTTLAYTAVFALTLLFPYYAIQSRAAEYRGTGADRLPATLNGLAQLQQFNVDEYNAIMWLRQNVAGTPTIVEAIGGQYSAYARVSANTGIPTVLGWAGHEYQWRGSDTPEPGRRAPAVEQIYTEQFWDNTAVLLNDYDVEYIYVSGLEANTYGPTGLEKFAERLEVAYQNNSVTIYHWQPQ
jgi:uncharacterized membrane protein